MKTKLNFFVVLSLLFGLVCTVPAQAVSAQSPATADFTFTSLPNPSNYRQMVTFTLSATGSDANYAPYGYVDFYADGEPIWGCTGVKLNMVGTSPSDGINATCSLATLGTGSHEIKVFFDSQYLYADEWVTLEGGHTVNETPAVTITPDSLSLPDAVYGMHTNQQLTATWEAGLEPDYVYWKVKEGSLPGDISLTPLQSYGAYLGELKGWPGQAGTFTFTVEAHLYNSPDSLGTHAYTWTILPATPVVTIGQIMDYGGKTHITIVVQHSNSTYTTQPDGTVTVLVDGSALAECTNMNANPYVLGSYDCATSPLANLLPGKHTLQAEFTPDAAHAANYTSGSTSMEFTNPTKVTGLLFEDLDLDGIRDGGEQLYPAGYARLDQGCDGSYVEQYTFGSPFSFDTTPGAEYCLAFDMIGNWRPTTTTTLPIQFTAVADQNENFEIGFYDTVISISPETLPDATVGVPYLQNISIDGGTEPYEITVNDDDLPAGLTFDLENFILSGTPQIAGYGYFGLSVTDADGMTGYSSWSFEVIRPKADGTFALASSKNPSTSGEEVTFTFSGSGDVVIPEYSEYPIPPFGTVAFYDGLELIPGCEWVLLNMDYEGSPGDVPAVCVTSDLGEGSHEIRAEFTDEYELYNNASRSLTQVVQPAVAADLSITKTDKTDPVKPGAKLEYTLVVSNAGPDAAESLTLVDKLDVTTTFSAVSAPKGWKCSYDKVSGKVTCTAAKLAAGASATIKITVTVSKAAKVGKELVNNAAISSATFDPDLLNNTVVEKTMVTK